MNESNTNKDQIINLKNRIENKIIENQINVVVQFVSNL